MRKFRTIFFLITFRITAIPGYILYQETVPKSLNNITFGDYCIRSYEYSDQEALVKYANNNNISRLLRDQFPFPYTKTNAETWLIKACNHGIETNFVIANEKELIGAVDITLQ